MSARFSVNRPDFVVNQALPATGSVLLGTDSLTTQSAPGTVVVAPYSSEGLLEFNNLSITLATGAGSTAVGTVTVQVTDFGATGDIYGSSNPYGIPSTLWANTTYTIAVASGQNCYNLNIPSIAAKWMRLSYTATSGTGTCSVAISLRQASRA